MDVEAALDAGVRRHVYDIALREGTPPTIAELAVVANTSASAVRESLARLAAARVFVLQRDSAEILMAPPFSAVPTPFVVQTRPHAAYANCAWDALGVAVMMKQPARVGTSCGCCGEAMSIHTSPDHPPAGSGIIHFAVPAARWWDDLVFT